MALPSNAWTGIAERSSLGHRIAAMGLRQGHGNHFIRSTQCEAVDNGSGRAGENLANILDVQTCFG